MDLQRWTGLKLNHMHYNSVKFSVDEWQIKANDFSEANSQTEHNTKVFTDWSLEKRRGKIYAQK